MDLVTLIWQLSGGLLGVLIGRQATVITLKQRRLSIDAGLDWPWEWASSFILSLWALSLGFVLALVALAFSFEAAFLGFIAGIPIGFLFRKIWRINETVAELKPEKEYQGD